MEEVGPQRVYTFIVVFRRQQEDADRMTVARRSSTVYRHKNLFVRISTRLIVVLPCVGRSFINKRVTVNRGVCSPTHGAVTTRVTKNTIYFVEGGLRGDPRLRPVAAWFWFGPQLRHPPLSTPVVNKNPVKLKKNYDGQHKRVYSLSLPPSLISQRFSINQSFSGPLANKFVEDNPLALVAIQVSTSDIGKTFLISTT